MVLAPTQWFNFAVSNVRPGKLYKFNIVNFRKKQSLFSAGKRPLVCLARPTSQFSKAAERAQSGAQAGTSGAGGSDASSGWQRSGAQIAYYPSPYRGRPSQPDAKRTKKLPPAAATKKGGKAGASSKAAAVSAASDEPVIGPGLYCCTFTLTFDAPGTYHIASCYPYSYYELQEYLDSLQRRLLSNQQAGPSGQQAPAPGAAFVEQLPYPGSGLPPSSPGIWCTAPHMVRSLLCYTLAGQRAELLTITDFSAPLDVLRQRECIGLTARVHPGETCASWIMQVRETLRQAVRNALDNYSLNTSIGCDARIPWPLRVTQAASPAR